MLIKNNVLSDTTRRTVFGLLLAGSVVGLVASAVLSYEALVIAKDSSATLSCDLNVVVSCGTVGKHWSAHLLGIPNSFIGMVAYPVFITIAVAGMARTQFPRWFMKAAQAGAVISVIFAAWMFYMSYAVIGSLCPWCMTTDIATLVVLLALIRYNALTDNLCVKGQLAKTIKRGVEKNYDIVVLISLIVLAIAAIIIKFGAGLF